jgi:hypothetical protein
MVLGTLSRFRRHTADTGVQGGAGVSPATPATAVAPAPDVLTGLQRLIEKQGGEAGRVAELLYRENHDLREKNRALAGQVPGQGAVVLPPEQAAQWTAYTALGKAEELKTALEARTTAETKLASLEREATLRQVQDASGFKASVLGQLPGAAALAFTVREVEADGKQVPTAFVKDAAGVETPLAAYAAQHWADFLPALAVAQGGTAGQGVGFVTQATGGTAPSNPVDAFIQQSNARRTAGPNPLARK